MEKLQVTKIEKSKKIEKNNKKGNKKAKNSNKIQNFFVLIKKNKFKTISLVVFNLLVLIASILVFSKNSFYEYLSRPKILENSFVIIALFSVFSITLFVHFVLKLQNLNYKGNEIKNVGNNECNLDITNPQNKHKIVDISKKNIVIKIFEKISQKSNVAIIYLMVYSLLLVVLLSFSLYVLWLCVFLLFFVFFVNIKIFMDSRRIDEKIVGIILVLNSLCILLSMYLIYLLN